MSGGPARALRLGAMLALALPFDGLAGASPAAHLGGRRPARAEAPAPPPECPPGHHPARSGRHHGCVDDALATCPHGYAQLQPQGSACLRCMSLRLRGARRRCEGGEEPAVDARGMHRCALPEDDRCRPGYAVQSVPGEGARCARWFD